MLRETVFDEATAVSEREEVPANSDWFCWHIMQCDNERCAARERGNSACWEIARELDDYRTALNVCADCLVYLSQRKNSILSKVEIDEILKKKGLCVLRNKCQSNKE
ncbi:MAG: hypothetical protein HY885_00325 [Deltaproteobacteria bacterium]|nr:hypothetical protein [Deltaproteobacteria bacterium]